MRAIRHIEGQPFYVPSEPAQVSQDCETCCNNVLGGEYSYPRDSIEDVRTVLDIGCNLGAFTVWACRIWWPGRIQSVRGYDPHAQALRLAQINTHGLPFWDYLSAVTTNPHPKLAVEDGRPDNWGGFHTYEANEGYPVHAIDPRDLAPADVLKVDCEGCELEIFENYPHLAVCKVVMLEYHRPQFRKPIMDRLRALGFVMKRGNPDDACGWDTQSWVKP